MKVDEQVFALITAIVVAVAGAYVSNKTGADGNSPSAYDRKIADELMYMTRVKEEFAKTMMIHYLADTLSKEAAVIQTSGKSATDEMKEKFSTRMDLLESMVEKARDEHGGRPRHVEGKL